LTGFSTFLLALLGHIANVQHALLIFKKKSKPLSLIDNHESSFFIMLFSKVSIKIREFNAGFAQIPKNTSTSPSRKACRRAHSKRNFDSLFQEMTRQIIQEG